jgi:hypothetical protein
MNLTLAHGSWFSRLSAHGRRGGPRLALGLPALAALAAHQALLSRPYIDDSYIFYRYAANWAAGLGPVFNRGEHVEGFSSFLWTAILAVAGAVGLPPQRAGPVLGVAFAAGTVVLVVALALALATRQPWLAAASGVALALSPAFAVYASSGMDTALFAFVLLCAVGASARYVESARAGAPLRRAGAVALAAIIALVLARAEGPIYAIAIALAAATLCGPGAPARSAMARLALPAGAALATAVVVVVRQLVYGTWTPATVMAKGYTIHLLGEGLRNPGRLNLVWEDALRFGVDYAGALTFVVLVLVTIAIAIRSRREHRLDALPVLGTVAIALGLGVAVWNGGDWMPYRRLLVPVLPLMVPLGGWAAGTIVCRLARAARHTGAAIKLGSVAALGGATLAVLAGGLSAGAVAPRYEARQLEGIGRLLQTSPRPVRLLTNLAGILPYYAGSHTYVWDMLGLTDIHNARHGQIFSPQFGRTDPAYDFSRPFDLFVSNSSWDIALLADAPPTGQRGLLLFSNPQWARIPLYVIASAPGPLPPRLERFCGCRPIVLDAAGRRALLAQLERQHAFPPSLLDAARERRPFPA